MVDVLEELPRGHVEQVALGRELAHRAWRPAGGPGRRSHAAFPAHKTWEDFDFTAQPAADKPLIYHLAQLAWAQEHMNVCFFGPPGPGSHCPPHRRHRANSPAPSPDT